jgi:hypothetical protein
MEPQLFSFTVTRFILSKSTMPLTISNKVAAVYEDVRNDKTDTNWCILGYTDDKGEALDLVSQGITR